MVQAIFIVFGVPIISEEKLLLEQRTFKVERMGCSWKLIDALRLNILNLFGAFDFFKGRENFLEEIDKMIERVDDDALKLSGGLYGPLKDIEETEETLPTVKLREPEPVTRKMEMKDEDKWVLTGIPGFDKLLRRGIPAGSNIIVAGGPGSGKTIFCLQTLYNAASRGKDCVYLSMEERPERLKGHMLSFGFNVKEISRTEHEILLKAGEGGRISLKRIQPVQLARSIEALLEEASGTLPIKIDIVLDFIPEDFNAYLLALDSISAVETAFSGTRRQYRIYIEQLFRYFERLNLTTFIISESLEAPKRFSEAGVEEFLADGIIVFYNFAGKTERIRGVEIYKLRGTSHARRIVPMEITDKGIVVYPDNPPLAMPL